MTASGPTAMKDHQRAVDGTRPASPADATSDVHLDGVCRHFIRTGGATVAAVQDVDLTISHGEFVSVVGPSGCGKTTVLKMIAGLDQPTSGTIYRHGKRSTSPSRSNGIIYQQPTLLAWRTILQNVLLPVEIQDRRRARSKALVEEARGLLELVGLGGFEQSYPYELSGGMQQRVAMARALITGPELLLMDEPFGALDALTREQMNLELLRVWSSTNCSALFVTHSVDEAVILSDRVVVMSRRPGRVFGEVGIKLDRPRTLAMLDSAAGVQAREHVRELLESA